MQKIYGFSLVELSIVLVILGLLTGGILAGQSLIRASEMRAVSTEYSRWVSAVRTFQDKYFALPGDMANATKLWGKDTVACNAVTDPAGSPGTCNGNGDGVLQATTANATGETFQFWKQMALAGLIEGSYTGMSGAGGAGLEMIAGTNIPKSKLGNAGWGLREYLAPGWGGAVNDLFAGDYGNWLQLGGNVATVDNGNPVLKPEELWNIDTKMDDGKPALGKVRARAIINCTNGASVTDYAAEYKLSTTGVLCAGVFPQAFNR